MHDNGGDASTQSRRRRGYATTTDAQIYYRDGARICHRHCTQIHHHGGAYMHDHGCTITTAAQIHGHGERADGLR
jgi:hypothetical protein